MEEFPDRRPDIENLDKRVDIAKIQPLIEQICQFLMTKATHEMRKQDKFNPTQLGNVSFHFDYNPISKETRLMFDKHPSTWRIPDIHREMLNMEADIMMEGQADDDYNDNPFTY